MSLGATFSSSTTFSIAASRWLPSDKNSETERPLSVKICVLLRKDKARLRQVQADYVGFEIADEFVVGYGLDYMERYRNLPCIGVLRKDLIR